MWILNCLGMRLTTDGKYLVCECAGLGQIVRAGPFSAARVLGYSFSRAVTAMTVKLLSFLSLILDVALDKLHLEDGKDEDKGE